eukprot:gb/GFBE01062788.1/.p1 GENE.gb/GFBE01062788.1/~~gb/GFBE01062788.1/.p1  ORF type:complete len:567 (+),score=150.73 gb/GFBE01062788.1/:1-1701(+)
MLWQCCSVCAGNKHGERPSDASSVHAVQDERAGSLRRDSPGRRRSAAASASGSFQSMNIGIGAAAAATSEQALSMTASGQLCGLQRGGQSPSAWDGGGGTGGTSSCEPPQEVDSSGQPGSGAVPAEGAEPPKECVPEDELMPFKKQKTRTLSVDDQTSPGGQLQRRKSVACMEGYLQLKTSLSNPGEAEAAPTADSADSPRAESQLEAVTKENVAISLRVVRGQDWCWEDEDGGDGQVGIILSFNHNVMTAQVLWERSCQAQSHYRYGKDKDLAIYRASQQGEVKAHALTLGKRNSQEFFSAKSQTLLIFDWDDTLFPTTYVRDDMELSWRKPMKDQNVSPREKADITKKLDQCAANVVELLKCASKVGKVVLVTLARSPWVAESCKNFFPRVGRLIKELKVPIVYAQEGIKEVEYNKAKMSSDEEVERFWSSVKGKAIARECRDFYNQYEGQSWKNVISIGDSDFERLGTQIATEDYMRETGIEGDGRSVVDVNGHMYKVRTKTFKMVDQPTIEELTVEVEMLRAWLPLMVKLDSGFDVNLNNADDPQVLRTIERTLRGEAVSGK